MTTNPMKPRKTLRPDVTNAFKQAADDRVKLTIRISPDLRRDLHIQARIDDISVNELLVQLISDYVANDPGGTR